jgi:FMN-dependent NADH-azoreductase
MKKLLHVVASPRGSRSRTLRVARAFVERFVACHPEWLVDELNVFEEELPGLSARQVDGKYILLGNRELYGDLREQWQEIERHIERFKAARAYLISTPMWNFSIPYPLKQYLDILIQPTYLFRYAGGRVEGLLAGRRAVVVSSCGGAYSTPETAACDHVESYLRTVLGFVGVSDVRFIKVESLDGVSPQRVRGALEAAQGLARACAEEPFG